MYVDYLIGQKQTTKYKVAIETGIPHATLSDICSGKTNIMRCEVETIYKLAKSLGVSIEQLVDGEMKELDRQRSYEYGLPAYLQADLDAYKIGIKQGNSFLDCLWSELYSSINIAEIDDGLITPKHANYLRKKYLWG